MANGLPVTPGSGDTVAAVDLTTFANYPADGKAAVGVIYVGPDGSTEPTPVTATNGLYVRPATASTWTVTGAAGTFPVTDSGGSITVDAPATTPVFVRLSTGSAAIDTIPVDVTPASPVATDYLPVRITDGSGFLSGGSEYTEGDTDATISGTAFLWEDASDTLRAVSAAKPLPISVAALPALVAGTANIGDVDVLTLPAIPAGTNTIGNVGALPVTSGGLSGYSFLSTAAVQAASIKGSAGQAYTVNLFNTGTTPVFARLYNQATSPGTGDAANILWRGIVPGDPAGAGLAVTFPFGLAFSAGIGIRVSSSVADNDATALAASGVLGSIAFK